MVQRSTKFTGICIAIYLIYALFVFVVLPMLLPDPVALSRTMLAHQTKHLGNLTNFTLEAGGTPRRSLLVTFRGSGALSLLDYLSRQPGCYHHFSPLIAYRKRITEKIQIEHALDELAALYNCDYNQSIPMLNYGMRTPTFRNFYGLQWSTCVTYASEVCWDPQILSQICKMYPFINMSVYNLGLKYLAALIERSNLNMRILLLVRDPRATMASRANRDWCMHNPECFQPNDLCSNMVTDYTIAQRLLQEYPQRFGVIRYEELALTPVQGLKTVFDFYGLPLKDPDNTKKSKSRRFHNDIKKNNALYFERPMEWQKLLETQEIKEIQSTCEEAMKLWGYHPIHNFDGFKVDTFVPLKDLSLFSRNPPLPNSTNSMSPNSKHYY